MLIIFGFLLTVIFGLFLILAIVPKMDPLARLGGAYLLGLGLQTFFMFLLSFVNVSFTRQNGFLILLVPTICLLPLVRKRIKPYFLELKTSINNFSSLTSFEKIIILFIIPFFLYSLIYDLYWPVTAWDALVIYDWRAKLFAATGSMEEAIIRGNFFGYPLLSSLAHTWVYLLGGKYPQFVSAILYFAFALMFYGAVKETTSRLIGLLSVVLLITIPDILFHSTSSYTNLPYAAYYDLGTIYLFLWMKNQTKGYLVLGCLLTGLSAWARSSEPFWLVNLGILVIYAFMKRKYFAPIVFSLIFFPIQQPWRKFEGAHLGENSPQAIRGVSLFFSYFNIPRLIKVCVYLLKGVVSTWQPLIFLFLLTVALEIKKKKIENFWLLLLIIGDFLLMVVGTFIVSYTYAEEWELIPGSVQRMAMFFLPLFVFYIFSSDIVKGLFAERNKKLLLRLYRKII